MNAPAGAEPRLHAPLTHRETMWIVAGVLLPVFIGSMDQTVLSSALPTIGKALGGTSHLSWVVAANLLTATAMTPLYGKISDIVGRRTTILTGICVFLVGSLVSALAFNLPMLIVGRAIQGLGSGGLTSVAMTVLGDIAAPKERARYYTYFSIVYITSGALGPLWGGFVCEYLHWSLIFWANLPAGLLALIVTSTLLKRLPRHERPHRLDVLGAILVVAASSTCMFVLNAGGHSYAWTSPTILGLSLLSFVCWIAFIARIMTAPEPLIPLRILRNPIVRCAVVSNGVGWASVIGLNIYLPLFLQAVHGYSPSASGLALMPLMVTVNGGALVGAQIAARITHYKYPPMATILVSVAACLWLAFRSETIETLEFAIVMAVIGCGFGPVAPVSTVAMQNAVELHELGISSGTVNFVRSLVATAIVAIDGVIILGGAPIDADGGFSAEALQASLFADAAATAAHFRVIFAFAAAAFFVVFVALMLMEERPLLSERSRA
jgi:EmrB/QacA subfamily drug resistance transporter